MKFLFTLILLQISVFAQAASYIKWYQSRGGVTYCGEYTPSHDFMNDVVGTRCRNEFPPHISWYRSSGGVVYCGEYTPENFFLGDVSRLRCKEQFPTYTDWYKSSGGIVYCGEYTPNGWFMNDVRADICRDNPANGKSNTTAAVQVKALTLEEVNRNLAPPVGAQVILKGDLAVPRNQGCAAPADTDKNFQCYVCQAQSTRNTMLYTKDGILELGSIQMLDARDEIRINLVNSDDLGSIRCMSKNKSIIPISTFEELMKALDMSGLKYKEPAPVVKTLGIQRTEP